MPDEIRLLLDTQPEQLGGGVEEGATLGSRLELNVATETTVAPIQPQMDELGPGGCGWKKATLPTRERSSG